MNKFLFVVGPTCSGKNDYAYELSKLIDIEVINADSIQVYKQLKILSNRPTEQELKIGAYQSYYMSFIFITAMYMSEFLLTNISRVIVIS